MPIFIVVLEAVTARSVFPSLRRQLLGVTEPKLCVIVHVDVVPTERTLVVGDVLVTMASRVAVGTSLAITHDCRRSSFLPACPQGLAHNYAPRVGRIRREWGTPR